MMKQLFILPFLFLCFLAEGQGISDTSLYHIETIDGNEYYGKIRALFIPEKTACSKVEAENLFDGRHHHFFVFELFRLGKDQTIVVRYTSFYTGT